MRLAMVAGRLALVRGDRLVDLSGFGDDPMAAFERWDAFIDWARTCDGRDEPLDLQRLGPPVPRPRQVFAIALNYPPHAAEAGYQPPADPLVFTKFPTCLTGPYATVELPGDKVDWEVELVVVIGAGGYRISEDRAWQHVGALTVGQDLSDRHTQMLGAPPQFSLAKSFPGFGPIGPVLVSPDELSDPNDLEIVGELNGAVVQQARTKDMIFAIPELVGRISAICPLLPGDLIFTGTPAGVGNRMTPPRYLRPGDELVSRVEGIGELHTLFGRRHYSANDPLGGRLG
ncbi:fumarylacetoacetate hydrolase family protein [Mycobacterium sp. 1245852.3]|uniref:fumarylacetoacetate hydrolase family protein n=1 Tax=Mycobacterium sp. 1245852.3 TaxID=1856860 RepID=UPI0008003F3B|nr:fumarylacetoacetate hydrolase family protein [Mycobacterium sp. 1245852.3]OBJ90428.1 fumarylacetoacetate hydrolase [Mycobacterium sp. 1245852.3]